MDIITNILMIIFICTIVIIPIVAIRDEIEYQKLLKKIDDIMNRIDEITKE